MSFRALTRNPYNDEILKRVQGDGWPKIEKSPAAWVKTLLREHYMKMKKLLSFLLHGKTTTSVPINEIIVVKCHYIVVFWAF